MKAATTLVGPVRLAAVGQGFDSPRLHQNDQEAGFGLLFFTQESRSFRNIQPRELFSGSWLCFREIRWGGIHGGGCQVDLRDGPISATCICTISVLPGPFCFKTAYLKTDFYFWIFVFSAFF